MMWTKRTYWTLKEVVEKCSNIWQSSYDTGRMTNFVNMFDNELENAGFVPALLTDELRSTEADILWVKNITGKYRDCYCVWKDNDDELTEQDCYDFWVKYIHVFNDTWFYYKNLINIYENNINSLMDGIKVTSENKFNDTPQNAQGIYNWSDDDHLTNVSRNESVTDGSTKMTRLKEIENQLSDLYSRWAEEFRRIFIYE